MAADGEKQMAVDKNCRCSTGIAGPYRGSSFLLLQGPFGQATAPRLVQSTLAASTAHVRAFRSHGRCARRRCKKRCGPQISCSLPPPDSRHTCTRLIISVQGRLHRRVPRVAARTRATEIGTLRVRQDAQNAGPGSNTLVARLHVNRRASRPRRSPWSGPETLVITATGPDRIPRQRPPRGSPDLGDARYGRPVHAHQQTRNIAMNDRRSRGRGWTIAGAIALVIAAIVVIVVLVAVGGSSAHRPGRATQ